MGLGGDLIWNGVFRALQAHDGENIVVAHAPKLSDLLLGRLYDRSEDLAQRPAFAGNPRLSFPPVAPKSAAVRALDRAFSGLLSLLRLRRPYERAIMRLAARRVRRGKPRLVHVDMLVLSYAERETRERMIWKQGGHAIQVILREFGLTTRDVATELYLDPAEERRAAELMRGLGIAGAFVTFEPSTNPEWFGQLRNWPPERWVELVAALRQQRPHIPLVQLGMADAPLVPGAVDLRGQTTFREAAAVIRRGSLFVGTEGGLMHAARAVDAPAVILWGGLTLPEFAGYPDRHRIICHRVACAPCGQKGWCDNDHICMRSITVAETIAAVLASLPPEPVAETRIPV
jgi:ADP-heptose:LPS heptosyltransferase